MATPISRRTVIAALGLGTGAAITGCSDDPESDAPPPQSSTIGTVEPSASSSTTSESPSGEATSATVELPSPDEMEGPWAAYAAVWAATQSSDRGGPRAIEGDWYYETAFGHWAMLLRSRKGRAVLAGSSDPSVQRSASEEKEHRQRLLAGGETWWGDGLKALPPHGRIGFLCAWDGKEWRQTADVDGPGGLGPLELLVDSAEETGSALVDLATAGGEKYQGAAKLAADAVVKAGPKVTEAQLTKLGKQVTDAEAGVEAAKAFGARPRR